MAIDPLRLGVAHDAVVEVSLDRDGLEWLASLCPSGDGFTRDLWDALREVDEREAAAEQAASEASGLAILVTFPEGGEDGD